MHRRTVVEPCKIERRVGRAPRRRTGSPAPAMATFAASLSIGASSAAMAGPTGGTVVQGQGTIATPSSTQTVINQSSQQLTLNWSSFNVGANESVRFYQPSSTSVAFNRILGQSASQIFGQIDANGKVVLINPNGLLIGRTAVLNVSSLIVSSLDAIDFNAATGGYRFSATRSNPGSVVNEGLITAQPGGSVTLLGGQVSNSGTIIADYGTVNLAAGRTATLDLAGDGLLRLEVGAGLAANPDGAVSAVENSGSIVANGGHVLLTASAVKNVFENLVNNTGVVRADRISDSGGTIELLGPGGTVLSSGTLDASAGDEVSTGGSVSVEGDRVALLGNAVVNVSGATGGGTALIGGDTHGANPEVLDASRAYVSSGATIDADAGTTGDGGHVVVWSNDFTQYFGSLSARGGSLSGNAGSAEVSGKQSLEFAGTANLTAPHGTWGTLLLDPATITIDGSNAATDTTTSMSVTVPNTYPSTDNAGDAVTIGSQVIETLLGTSSVSLSATGAITQLGNVSIDSSGDAGASHSGLTLHAGTSISLGTNSQIDTNNGAIDLQADAGNITLGAGSSLNAGNALVTLKAGGTGNSIVSNSAGPITTTGTLTLSASGQIGASGTTNAVNTDAGAIVATANNGSIFIEADNGTTLTNLTAIGVGNSVNVVAPNGNLEVESVNGDGVSLTATSGNINDAVAGTTPVITSTGAVALSAGIGIGTAPGVITNLSGGTPLYVAEATGITAAVASPSGQIDLNVINSAGPVTLAAGAIQLGTGGGSTTGTIVVQSPGILEVAPGAIEVFTPNTAQVALNSSGGTLTLEPGGSITDQTPATLLLSGNDIEAPGGATPHTFNLAADNLDFIASAPTGDIVLNTTVSRLDANIGAGGNLTVNQTGALNLGAITAAGTVAVDAIGGAINSVGSQTNITSDEVTLQGISIGANGAPITTAAASAGETTELSAMAPSGAVYVTQQTGNLAVLSATGLSVALTASSGTLTEGVGGNIVGDQVTLQGTSIGSAGTPVNTYALSVGDTTTLSATATAGVVNVSQQFGNLAVNSVSGGNVTLVSLQAITEAPGGGNITSNQINLQGTSIGTSGAPVDLAATTGAGTTRLTATSGGAVYLSQEIGNVAVNAVSGSSVTLGANDAITEAAGGGSITSNQVFLQGASIGANGAPVDLAATSSGATTALTATSGGAVYVSQGVGALGVGPISGSSVNLGFNSALVEEPSGSITSNQVTLGGMSIGASGAPIVLAATAPGATTVVSASDGNGIYLAQQTGNETLSATSGGGPVSVTTANGGNLAVATVTGTSVALTAAGAITEGAGGTITSDQITLQGASIGTSTAAVDTAATSGASTTALIADIAGGVYVAQQTGNVSVSVVADTGPVSVSTANGGNLVVSTANGASVVLSASGALTESAGGAITSDQIILQGASIGSGTVALNTFASSGTATSVLSATSSGVVNVDQQSGTLAVASASGTSVTLASVGAITEASGGGNITSNQISLQGTSIGTSTAAVDTAATSGAATTVLNATASGGGVYVEQQTGTLAVASASGASVALTAGGALTEAAGGTITSDQITLQGASIGSSTNALNTFAATSADTTVLSATAGGGVYVAQQTGTLAVGSASGTSVALTSAGAITEAAGGGNITSNQITLQGTSIGTSTASVDTAATSGAATTALNATTTAPGGAIYLQQQIGNVSLAANSNGGLVGVATTGGSITVTSATGSALDLTAGGTGQSLSVTGTVDGGAGGVTLGAAGGINLSAVVSSTTDVTLTAGGAITATSGGQISANLLTASATAIGSAGSPLNTAVATLDTNSTAGGTFIAQAGDVTVSSAAAGPLDVETSDGNLTETSAVGSGITLIAGGTNKVLTLNSALSAGADDVKLAASGDGGSIVLNGSVSTTGNATLDAGSTTVGGTITEAAGVSVTSTGLTLLAAAIGAAGSPLVTSATTLNATSTDGGIYVTPTAGLALTANATGGAVDVETVNGPLTVASAAGDGVTLATSGAGNTLMTTGTVDGRAVGVTLSTSGAGSNIILGGGVISTGDLSVSATGAGSGIALNASLNTPGDVSITAGSAASPGVITAGTGGGIAANTVSITGASIGSGAAPLTTAADSVNATSLEGGIYLQQVDALSLNASATGGSVNAATTNGALAVLSATGTGVTLAAGGAGQNLNVDGAINGGTGAVSLSAPGGSIAAGAGESIAGASLTAAADSIGSSTAPLATTVGVLNAASTNGGIFVTNTEALAMTASATGGAVDVTTTDGALTVASAIGSGVSLATDGASSDITVNGPIGGGGGDVTLLASGARSNINLAGALTTTGDATLTAGTATNPGAINTAVGNRVTANTLSATGSSIGSGSVALNTTVGTLNATSYGGSISVAQTGALDLSATASGGSLTVTTTNGPLTVETADGTGVTLAANGTGGAIDINGSVNGASGEVSLATPGALVGAAGTQISADNLTVSASQIGTSGSPLNTAANSLNATSTAGGIYVNQSGSLALNGTATGGALNVQAANGALTVGTAVGSTVTLVDNGGAIAAGSTNSITGNLVTLEGAAIGTGAAPLHTDTPSLNATSTNGGIYVQQTADMALTASATGGLLDVNTGGALTVASAIGDGVTLTSGASGTGITVTGAVNGGTGPVTLATTAAGSGIVLNNTLSTSGDVTLTAGTLGNGGSITGGAGSQIDAASLVASGSSIGSSGSPLATNVSSLNTTSTNGGTYVNDSDAVTLTAAATGGALNVQTVDGALTVDAATGAGITLTAGGAGSGLVVGGAVSAGTGDVSLTAGTAASRGAIVEGAGGQVTGGTLTAVAASIGSSAAPLSTAVGSLIANTSAGDIDINQQGSLKLASVQAAGNLDVSAANGDLVVGNVSAANSATLTANSGAINDDGDDTTRLTANTETLLARSIGAPSTLVGTTIDSSQRLDTDATNLVATSTAGGVYINQLSGLSSASVHASGGKSGNIELLTAKGDINILNMNASGTLLLAAGGNIYALPGAGAITAQAAELRAGGADPTAGHIGTLSRPLILELASGDTLRMFVPQTVSSSDASSAPSTLPSAGVESTLVLFSAPSSLSLDAGFGQFQGLSESQFTSQAELLVHSIQNQTASVESVLGLDWSSFDPNVSLFGKLDPAVCLPGDQRDEEQGAGGAGEKCAAP